MSFTTLPESLQGIIQEGMLEREFKAPLTAKTGFRAIADQEAFPARIGETLTKTRAGLLPSAKTPLGLQTNDLDNGIAHQNFPVEQYSLSVAQYGSGMKLNLLGSATAISSVFLQNAKSLGEQAHRTMDELARDALFDAYMGGDTIVAETLSAAGADLKVDDVRGFVAGQTVSVNDAPGVLIAQVTPDTTNTSMLKAFGGKSGVLKFASNITVANGTIGKTVRKADAAYSLSADDISVDMVLDAAAQLRSNGVPTLASGRYRAFVSPKQVRGLYRDAQFKNWMQGNLDSSEARSGIVSVIGGVEFVETNLNPVYSGGTLGIVVGQGALIEGQFTANAYAEANSLSKESITWVDGVAHITRSPIDALQQVVTQSWASVTGFTAPTDIHTTPDVLPSASNAALKRGVVLRTK